MRSVGLGLFQAGSLLEPNEATRSVLSVEFWIAKIPYSNIYDVMKTTIDLPDEIFRDAKILAVKRSVSFREIMTQALSQYLAAPEKTDVNERQAKLRQLLTAMRASNTEPMQPLTREEIYDR